ncbi:PglL family O-oligosaccharyltransferase [Enterobacter cloacae complex sp. I2]|uniref:PglL family O-oligosaccharyltransferase n=1 Tax=Enterobacter cloacae complex sp. I2 TaxID=2779603 RepID=UPI0018682B60|nr:O-antigen ligase family protein [Enterobacter cloacae complex sp. I2]MBE3513138.1 O-antigen ligase C-terminal domain-containing protein [Enterobacter cloacae complex sp. I2]
MVRYPLWLSRHWPVLLLLVLTFLSFPGSYGPGMLSGHNLLVWSCVLLWAGLMWSRRDKPAPCRGLTTGVLIATLLMTLPLLWTPHPAWRLNALPRLIGMWAGAGLFLLLLRTRFGFRGRTVLVAALAVAGALQALMALAQLLFPLSPIVRGLMHYDVLAAQGRALGSIGQVNLLGSFLAVSAGATLWCLLTVPVRRRGLRLGGCAVLIVILTALVVARSRTGWLGGILSCGGVLWLAYGHRCWRALVGCLLLSGVLSAAVFNLQPQVRVNASAPSVSAPDTQTFSLDRMRKESKERRLQMLRVTSALIMHHPFSGNGLGSFERRWSEGLSALHEVSATPERVIYPHNELLYVWCEGGVVALAGLLLAGGLWLLPALRAWRMRDSKHAIARRQYATLWPLSLPLVLHSMTEFPFYLSALHFVLFLLIWRLSLPDGRTRSAELAPGAWLAVPACLMGLVLLASSGVNLYRLRALEQDGFSSPLTLVLPEVSAVLQADRLQFDRCVSLLIAYNQPRDVRLLQAFVQEANGYLSAHDDPNLMDSLIRIENALGRPDLAAQTFRRAKVSFPADPRFNPEGARS